MDKSITKEARVERARAFFRQGYNCCQSVVLAFDDVTGLDEKTVATITAGFGGGIGRLREVCGCVSGMTAVAGFICPYNDTSRPQDKKSNYQLVQKLAYGFKNINGSIICGDLLGTGRAAQSPVPEARTPQYYQKRPCEELVGIAAGLLSDEMNNF